MRLVRKCQTGYFIPENKKKDTINVNPDLTEPQGLKASYKGAPNEDPLIREFYESDYIPRFSGEESKYLFTRVLCYI